MMRVNGHDHDRARPEHTGSGPDDRAIRYCQAALDNATDTVRGSGDGSRNETLNSAAYGLAQLIGTGGLTEDTIREHLTIAAQSIGLDDREIRTTLNSGIRSGRADPRTIPPPSGSETPRRTAPRPAPAPRPTPETSSKRPAMDIAAYLARCTPATGDHGYIVRKGGAPDGLKIAPPLTLAGHNVGGWLAVPAFDLDGNLQTCQFIPGDPGLPKLSAPGHPIGGAVFVAGTPDGRPSANVFERGVVYLVEGLATAQTVYKVTGQPAFVTFGKGNMHTMGKGLRERHPDLPIVIAPDVGGEHQAAEIVRDIGGPAGWVEIPEGWPKNTDLNDLASTEDGEQLVREVLQNVKEAAAEADAPEGSSQVFPSISFSPISMDELNLARLTPRTIVPDLLYADVRTLNASGGTGKTTVALYEAVITALARRLWGRETGDTRRTVIVTREDSREILTARLREITRAMNLSRSDVAHVLECVRIIDVSGERFRLSAVIGDVVEPHLENIDWLTAQLAQFRPDRLIFDPLVSFGVGEARVNDAEQGLIEAFRIFRNRLDCCTEGIHHIGKANSREKTLDQYSGRGGSSLADGSRMVAVMQPLEADEWQKVTGLRLMDSETGIVMALPKLSYAKQQDPIYIVRHGYHFEMMDAIRRSPEQIADATAEQVLQFIRHEYAQGLRYSMSDLENSKDKMGLSRGEVRAAVTHLKVAGKVVYHLFNGKPGSHFEPIGEAARLGEAPAKTA